MAKKAIAAMSGGVDSSVAAKLLKDRGFNTVGIFLHFWKEPIAGDFQNKCCSTEAFLDAGRVCSKIGIKLYTLNFNQVFKKEIVDNFINEYKAGNTPNPCVRCNKFVKLGLLIKHAEKLGFDYVASGHYARVKKQKNIYKLYKAKDKEKDQSYFLYNLTQAQLNRLIFPLGEFTKEKTRKMARKFNLPVAEKRDSQEVCFIPEKSHNEFLKRHIKLKAGPIKLINGAFDKRQSGEFKTIGRHQGLPLYTIGQRRGVEIGGTGPYYVSKFDYKKNILYVVDEANHPSLFSDSLFVKDVNWISGVPPKFPLACMAVIRYRHKAVKCQITPLIKGEGGISVQFSEPQRAITPGQSIVFYKWNEVLGGGVIDREE